MYTPKDLVDGRNAIEEARKSVVQNLAAKRTELESFMDLDGDEEAVRRKSEVDGLHDRIAAFDRLIKALDSRDDLVKLIWCGWLVGITEKNTIHAIVNHRKINEYVARKLSIGSDMYSNIDALNKYLFKSHERVQIKDFVQGFLDDMNKFLDVYHGGDQNIEEKYDALAMKFKSLMEKVPNALFYSYLSSENIDIQVPSNMFTLQDWWRQPEAYTKLVRYNTPVWRLSRRSRVILREVLEDMKVVHRCDHVHANLGHIFVNNTTTNIIPIYKPGNEKDGLNSLKDLLEKAGHNNRSSEDLKSFCSSLANPGRMIYYDPSLWTADDTAYLLQEFYFLYGKYWAEFEHICSGIPNDDVADFYTNKDTSPYKNVYQFKQAMYQKMHRKVVPLIFKRNALFHLFEQLNCTQAEIIDDYVFAVCPKYMSAFMKAAANHLDGRRVLETVENYFLHRRRTAS